MAYEELKKFHSSYFGTPVDKKLVSIFKFTFKTIRFMALPGTKEYNVVPPVTYLSFNSLLLYCGVL